MVVLGDANKRELRVCMTKLCCGTVNARAGELV